MFDAINRFDSTDILYIGLIDSLHQHSFKIYV